MSNWRSVTTASFIPQELLTLINGIGRLVDAGSTLLNLSTTALEVAETLATAADQNAAEAALNTLVDGLQDVISGLAGDTTAHAILIPFNKQPYGIGVPVPEERRGVADGARVAYDNDFAPQHIQDFMFQSTSTMGGLPGFWNTLTRSVNDEGDISRPDFPDNFAVGGSVLLFGGQTLEDMGPMINTLETWFGTDSRSEISRGVYPTITGFKVDMVPRVSETSGPAFFVRLEWDSVPRVENPSQYSPDTVITDEIIVIRSTNPRLREAQQWSDIFPTDITDTSMPTAELGSVVLRVTNDGFNRLAFDETELELGIPYYYALAPRYIINGKRQPMGRISAVKRVFMDRPVLTKRSVAPDWRATPSLIEIFPPIQNLVSEVNVALDRLRARTVSGSGNLASIRTLINQAQALVAELEEQAQQLESIISVLRGLTNARVAMFSTTISVSTGGIDAWLVELANCLSDPTDDSRPQFANTDLVAGAVVLGGAPNTGQLREFLAALNIFFGNLGGTSQIDTILDSVPLPAATEVAATETPAGPPTFNAAMEVVSSDEAEC